MTGTIFLTGATGFVGQRLVPVLITKGWRLRVLLRDAKQAAAFPDQVEICVGDLTDPASYLSALDGVDAVVHLGALTGKASRQDHERINRRATKDLISACSEKGIKRFLFVSTIAAGYADKSFYPYSEAKAQAEQELAASELTYTVLRPTLVLGPDSPIADALGTLAGLPVVPLPQKGTDVSVQPIAVQDVARGIAEVLDRDAFDRETLDLGGPEVVSMRDLLGRIAQLHFGRSPRFLKLPLRLVQWPLALLEPVARNVMPATAGQFAVFGNNSTIADNWLVQTLQPEMAKLDDQIGKPPPKDNDGTHGVADAPRTAPQGARAEAETLGKHMSGLSPSSAAIAHYAKALETLGLDREGSRFDQLTLSLARRGGLRLWLVDGYCGLFHRHGVLRRRQVLCAAILENDVQTHRSFDDAPNIGAGGAFVRLAAVGLMSVMATLAGALVLMPTRIWLGRSKPAAARGPK